MFSELKPFEWANFDLGHPAVEVELWIKRASLLFQTAEADKFLFLLVKLSSRGVLGRNQVSDESFLVHKIVKEAKNFNVTLRSYMSLLSNLTTYWFSIRKSDWNFVLFLKDLITNPFFHTIIREHFEFFCLHANVFTENYHQSAFRGPFFKVNNARHDKIAKLGAWKPAFNQLPDQNH